MNFVTVCPNAKSIETILIVRESLTVIEVDVDGASKNSSANDGREILSRERGRSPIYNWVECRAFISAVSSLFISLVLPTHLSSSHLDPCLFPSGKTVSIGPAGFGDQDLPVLESERRPGQNHPPDAAFTTRRADERMHVKKSEGTSATGWPP